MLSSSVLKIMVMGISVKLKRDSNLTLDDILETYVNLNGEEKEQIRQEFTK